VTIHVALNHVSSYRYDRPVSLSPHLVRLRPAPHCLTPVMSYSLRVLPDLHFINWQQDPQSNHVARLVFPEKVNELRLEVDLVAGMSIRNPFDFFVDPEAERFPFPYPDGQIPELRPYLEKEPATPLFGKYLADLPKAPRTVDFLVGVNRRVQGDVRYLIRFEPGVQSKEETLEKGSGSCRDTSWLLVQLFRHLGLAARFVSGYLVQLTADEKALDGPTGPEQDFTDLHAWCEVFVPGAGWIGLDPTSGLLAGEGHIPLACTPEPQSAAPVSGHVDECDVRFEHTMSVRRVLETPRVTRPYAEAAWRKIFALGQAVDADLERMDVRLTMGGEPTFVSVDDREGEEWNTAALGPTKRARAATLLRRLKAHHGPRGFLHFGQGKWYPGEPLPRWALGCYWRADGEACWGDPALFAEEGVNYGFGPEDAERFVRATARRLGVGDEYLETAHEDAFYYLWRERKLPGNVDPFDARLEDEGERARLLRVFEQGLDAVVGYALPLAPAGNGRKRRWRSGPWFLRSERMYLLPGDSPMGYRLPLDSLPWVAPEQYPYLVERDPFEALGRLPQTPALRGRAEPRFRFAAPGDEATAPPGAGVEGDTDIPSDPAVAPARFASADRIVRTALCVEPRDGVLYVFLPPLRAVEDYLDLLAAVEGAAAELGMPVMLEGYPPPRDPRLPGFQITPDPGVIEVNVLPAANWPDLVAQTTTLYEEARQARLSTEKFMLDGRHAGTGGGNHVVLGGPTAADSPFLRRPDLLRSLLSYWHNHPSLSYLFAGLFIGPTSQAPRVDEARHDSLRELEIAFREVPPKGTPAPPWLVDRIFRHLLTDSTGNTHRTEFCIDKLYSPDGPTGRLGLVEMRAFEMPPHSRMSLVQQLLMRGLLARFWKEPYTGRLTRWGTELHDRFMLPYFVGLDFEDVIDDLRRAGYPFELEWFAPHHEFRFPLYGKTAIRGIELGLRQALEPWHVLGEEGAPGGTSRFVDSSVERVEVQVTGLTGDRFVVTCNGRAVPLHPTGRNGEAVAGVRYRAWRPPSCLHPTIGVHTPLVFDIVDTWMERSLGGCQYHVMHPGGRSYETFPVNAYEAESRRLSRFHKLGHTPGRLCPAPAERSREFPYTLDLRA
jgi:uncharacterized protein (DUF2126 family)/transglutaminase-like putative cysteine protease